MNFCTSILFICLFAYTVRGDEKVVIGSVGNTHGTNVIWEWVVPAARYLDPANAWDLDSQRLPTDLSHYCLIAKSNVMAGYKWSSTPELALLHIRQVSALVNPSDGSTPPVQRVVLAFHFREPGMAPALGPVQPVLMLLDGTIAEARFRSGKK